MKAFTHSFSQCASTALTLVICFLLLFIPTESSSQFQRYFGTNLNNSFNKVIQDGNEYYVLGLDQPIAGGLSSATISRLAFDGSLLWTRSLDISSQWNDAIRINPSGDLLVVGNSLPANNPMGKSIIGKIDASGNFAWVREYDAPERDLFLKIIENPIPDNPSFPYYILGAQKEIPGLSETWDDVVLLNMNANGNFNWKRIYVSNDDDEFLRDIEALPNGNLIISGSRLNTQNDHSGIIYLTDNDGKIIAGKIANWMDYPDMVQEGNGGGLYTASNSVIGQGPFISKFDQNLTQLWQVQIPKLTSIKQVWEAAPGVIYATGVGIFGSSLRTVIINLIDNSPNAPTLVWTKYLDANSTISGGTASLISGNSLAFTDGRVLNQGFGGFDAHISISDLDLNTCATILDNVTLVTTTLAPINYKFYNDSLINPITGVNLTSKLVTWDRGDFCIDCCANSLTFSTLINQGFTVVQSNCKFTITAPQFDSCYLFSTPPSLDGANVPQIITNPNGSWSYNFTQSGTHQVCVNVVDECNSKKMCTTINVNCDTCVCGPFDLQYSIGRGPLVPYDCGDTLYVPASTAIVPIRFLSSLNCLGTNCPQATIDLILKGPQGFIPIIISGVQAIPDFIMPFTNSTFSIAGLYTLTINGHCGGNICPCTIYFNAEGHDCCSNQFDFELGITNAVTISVDNTRCKVTLNIGNLPQCDSIGPIFWGDGTSTQGTFTAGTMPMHTYAANGSYFISWTVTEYDYSGMQPIKCFDKVYRDSINVNCCDTCKNNLVLNPGFSQGAVPGNLGGAGASNFWEPYSSPQVITTQPGACDPVSMQMWGNEDVGEAICQPVNFVIGKTYCIQFKAQFLIPDTNLITPYVLFGFTAASSCNNIDPFNCGPTVCANIGTSVQITNQTNWVHYSIPNWTVPNTPIPLDHLLIRAYNNTPNSPGNPNTVSWGRIDNICISEITTTGTNHEEKLVSLRIYPNPGNGYFTIELQHAATSDMRYSIIDLTGRVVLEKETINGTTTQNIDASSLASGFYLLQLISNGKVLAVEKLVKQ